MKDPGLQPSQLFNKEIHRRVSDNQELVIVGVTLKDVLDVEKYLLKLLRWHRFRHLLDSRRNPRGNV